MRISDWSSDVCSSDLCGRIQSCPGRSPKTQAVKACRHDFYASFKVQVVQIGPRTGGQAANQIAISRGEQVNRFGASLIAIGFGQYFQRQRSEEHTSELQSLMRISYAVFCFKKKTK